MDFLDGNDFTGGMNSDAENRTLPKGEYRTALNIRNGLSDGEDEGCITNVRGNLVGPTPQCPYNNYRGLPPGDNITIGTFEDTVSNSVIYMNWNSEGKHGIYRYYPLQGVTWQIMQYNFGWLQSERITSLSLIEGKSGQILYWIDSNGLKKINLDKGNVVNKQKSWKIYLVAATLQQPFLTIHLEGYSGSNLLNSQIPTSGHNADLQTFLNYVTGVLNGTSKVTATTCDCYIEVTEINTTGWNLLVTSGIGLVVADNWYGTKLDDILFTRAKAPFLWPPVLTYKQDPLTAFNNVSRRVFQSALQLYFDDFEQSVLGVASQIPIDNLQCDGTNNPIFNYIDIDFNNPDFITNLQVWLIVINQISVVVREHNTGTWKTVEILSPCDFLDYANGKFFCHYKFYNDIQATPLDAVSTTNLNSGIPITADSENIIFNRLVDGGITTDRDAPDCVQADYKIRISPLAERKLFKVTFRVRILSFVLESVPNWPGSSSNNTFADIYPSFHKRPFWRVGTSSNDYDLQRGLIGHDVTRTTNNFPFFGGGGFDQNTDYNIRAGMEDDFDQRIPEGGFPVYLAGTPFFGITRQISVGLPTDGVNALDTSTGTNKTQIGTYLQGEGDLYSEVTLMVPEGEYIGRVASHWCSFGVAGVDKLGKGFAYDLNGNSWRSTSTNVWGVYKPGSGIKPMNTPNSWDFSKEIKINVTADMPDAGTFLIADIAPPWFTAPRQDPDDSNVTWIPLNGYLFDDSNGAVVNDNPNDAGFSGIPVEKTMLSYESQPGNPFAGLASFCVTDHNGYFFGIGDLSTQRGQQLYNGFEFTAWQVNSQRVTFNDTVMWKGTLTDYYNKVLSAFDYTNSNEIKLQFGVVTTNLATARSQCSTIITGVVNDQLGQPISGTLALYQNGQFSYADTNGKYEIVAWGDMVTPNIPNFAPSIPFGATLIPGINRVVDSLIFSIGITCSAIYPNGQEVPNINLSIINTNPATQTNIAPFSPTSIFELSPFSILETIIATQKAEKRGGKKIWALRYYDTAGRVCSCVKGFDIYTPFETEDLQLFPKVIDPVTGNPYTSFTVLGGQPTISWSLNASFKPPVYAAYYQWMRTTDTIYGRYLQWVANSVQYISSFANAAAGAPAINTAYQNGNYVGALISISNLVSYAQMNPDSLVGYSYTAGDRLRIISDQSNVLINSAPVYTYTQGIYDFEITGVDSNNNLLVKLPLLPFEIKPGFTIEIYNQLTVASNDTQIFYEVGEVYKCTHPGQSNNAHSVTSGIFTAGDTYWRGRLILVADPLSNFTGTYPAIIEDASVSDFYLSLDNDINPSRVGIIDPNLKQIYYPDRLIVSDQFQEGSALNGLSFCLPTNITDLGGQYGNVARLIVISKQLHAIMKNNNITNMVGVVSLNFAQSTSTVEAISSDFLGTQNPSRQNMGTDFPGTVVAYDGYIFSLFSLRNAVWRHADDGAIQISINSYQTYVPGTPSSDERTRMANFFRQLLQNGNVWDATAIFDRQYREYILTVWPKEVEVGTFFQSGAPAAGLPFSYGFNGLSVGNFTAGQIVKVEFKDTNTGIVYTIDATVVIIGGSTVWFNFRSNIYRLTTGKSKIQVSFKGAGTTIAWNETQKRWTTPYSFVPECYGALGNTVYAFQDGQLWIQDVSQVRNNWFGVQYPSQITFVLNDKPEDVKVWNAISLMQLQSDGGNNWSAPVIKNDRGQLSRLLKGAWRKLEEFWYTAFKRDLTDVTKPNPIVSGRVLRSSSLVVTLENDATVKFKLYKVGYNLALSERTTK